MINRLGWVRNLTELKKMNGFGERSAVADQLSVYRPRWVATEHGGLTPFRSPSSGLRNHPVFSDAMSIEKRYFTSDLTTRSQASLICWIGMTSTSATMLCSPQKSSIS